MIKIIAGTFGYYNGRKVIPLTNADGPQKLDPELEARLVKDGIAEYIDADQAKPEDPATPPDPAGAPASQDPADPPEGSGNAEPPEYSEETKLEDLKKIAAGYGVDASAMRKKADVIAAIEAAKTKAAGANSEEPPQLGAADPV